ncbi:hypothetical protein ACFL22_01060 [Patescibacteria group bacterium]
MKKIAKSKKIPELQTGKYYVFENHIVFRQKDGIYAVAHTRMGEKSIVDSFEFKYSHLNLKWGCILDIKSSSDKKQNHLFLIRKKLNNL